VQPQNGKNGETKHPVDELNDYLQLINAILEYSESPSYKNYFAKFDKKLTKNLVKRCVVEPLCEKFLVKLEAEEEVEDEEKKDVATEQLQEAQAKELAERAAVAKMLVVERAYRNKIPVTAHNSNSNDVSINNLKKATKH